jgi:hypothetical protein
MMKRLLTYCALACCALFATLPASAMERTATYLAQTFDRIGEMQSASMTRMELTIATWRTGSEAAADSLKSNLRADSNHFVMISTAPAGVPDWDAGAKAC